MSRWNIVEIRLYSKDGRNVSLPFEPEAVNIITGPSHTGKSAIVEILDYCLGASACHIPGVVGEKCSWVGVVWSKGEQCFGVTRRLPEGKAKTNNEMCFLTGNNFKTLLPNTIYEMPSSFNRNEVNKLVEAQFGIGKVIGETLGTGREGKRISVRQVAPFILQDDDVIISKNTLLRGMNGDGRRQIIDSVPYFFGISDEKATANVAELRRLRNRLNRLESKEQQKIAILATEFDKAGSLLTEAVNLGLVPKPIDSSLEESKKLLELASNWTPDNSIKGDEGILNTLYEDENELLTKLRGLKQRYKVARLTQTDVNTFNDISEGQRKRLESINIFQTPSGLTICPVCSNPLGQEHSAAHAIHDAISQLDRDLTDVRIEKPRIDDYLSEQLDKIQESDEELEKTRLQIKKIIEQEERLKSARLMDHERSRLTGLITSYIDSATTVPSVDEAIRIKNLQEDIEELEGEVNAEGKKELLESEAQRIGIVATELLTELPFEETYRDSSVFLRVINDVTCGILTNTRSYGMRDVGSDENYLSLHVSVLCALHRHFSVNNSQIPGVLVFDQISRPYYPPEDNHEEVSIQLNDDTQAVYKYFEFLFKEVKRQEGLQFIIIEHAYLASSDDYKNAVVRRWNYQEKLIPDDWPYIFPTQGSS